MQQSKCLCWQERDETMEKKKLNETLQTITVIEMGNVIKTDISYRVFAFGENLER